MRKKLRHLSSEAGTKKATYDIALLKDGSRPKELNDLSGSMLEDQITIASGISETEASHLKKILRKNSISFRVNRHQKKSGDPENANFARGNIALFESLKDSGDYRINHIDCLCFACLAMLVILLIANAISAAAKADTELHRAVISQDAHKVKRIIEKRPEFLSIRDEHGRIPLHYAGSEQRAEIPFLMLEYGSPVNIMDNYGMTPADYALKNGNRIVFYLLKKKGAVSAVSESGY